MGDTDGAKEEIVKISDSKPRYMNAKGILVSTFKSVASPQELEDYFKLNSRTFLIFDMNPEHSGYFIDNKEIDSTLFAYVRENMDKLSDESARLAAEVRHDSTGFTNTRKSYKLVQPKRDFDVSDLSNKEREERINNIIDKGVENLTERDKELLEILSKRPK
jgi:hypothetical protein